MSRRYYVEATSSGKPTFVKIKRSRSHHHHHHDSHTDHVRHHHRRHSHWEEEYCPPTYYKVSREEWNVLKERERLLDENNKALQEENRCLRSDVAVAQDEVARLTNCVVPDLQVRNDALYAENSGLRRSLETAAELAGKQSVELDALLCQVAKLKKDNKKTEDENFDLKSRVKHLSRLLDDKCNRRAQDLLDDVRYWKQKYRDLQEVFDLRTKRMEAYEDILKRRGIIC